MESIVQCSYCLEIFDKSSQVPLPIECQHNFCSTCIKILKSRGHYQTCPFDNSKIEASSCDIKKKTSKAMCSAHFLNYDSFCLTHNVILCKNCKKMHDSCDIFIGNLEEIDSSFYQTLGQAVDCIENTDSDTKIFSIYDLLDGISWIKESCNDFFKNYQKFIDNLSQGDPPSKEMLIKLLKSTENASELPSLEYVKSSNENLSVSLSATKSEYSELFQRLKAIERSKYKLIILETNMVQYHYSCALLFTNFNTNKETIRSYVGHFEYCLESHVKIIGLGFGRCENPNDVCKIRDITFTIDEGTSKTITTEFEVSYDKGRISCIFHLTEPIILKNSSKVFFCIIIEGQGNYVFNSFVKDSMFKKLDIGKSISEDDFPVLFFVVGK